MASIRVGLAEVVGHFRELENSRSPINFKHPLVSVVVIAIMAVLADCRVGRGEARLAAEGVAATAELYLEPDGGEHVIGTNDRSSAKNLQTTFEKILKRAGVDAWPRLMQNLQSSRETELAQPFPIQTVTAWLGNTPKVALENYLQVRDEDFTKAIGEPNETASLFCAAPALRNPSATLRNGSHRSEPENNKPLVLLGNPTKQGVFKTQPMPPLGLEPRT